jgi:hypothetical protein
MNGYLLPFRLVDGQDTDGYDVYFDATGWTAQLAMRKNRGQDAVLLDGAVTASNAVFTLTSDFLASPLKDWELTLYLRQGTNLVNQASGRVSVEAAPELSGGVLLFVRTVDIDDYVFIGEFQLTNMPASVQSHLTLPATTNTLGHVIAGTGLSIDTNGLLSVTGVSLTSNDVVNISSAVSLIGDTANSNHVVAVIGSYSNYVNSTYYKKTGGAITGDVDVTGDLSVVGSAHVTSGSTDTLTSGTLRADTVEGDKLSIVDYLGPVPIVNWRFEMTGDGGLVELQDTSAPYSAIFPSLSRTEQIAYRYWVTNDFLNSITSEFVSQSLIGVAPIATDPTTYWFDGDTVAAEDGFRVSYIKNILGTDYRFPALNIDTSSGSPVSMFYGASVLASSLFPMSEDFATNSPYGSISRDLSTSSSVRPYYYYYPSGWTSAATTSNQLAFLEEVLLNTGGTISGNLNVTSNLTADTLTLTTGMLADGIYYGEEAIYTNTTLTAAAWEANNNGYFVGIGTTNITITLPSTNSLLQAGIAGTGKEAKFSLAAGNGPLVIVDQDGQGFEVDILERGKQVTIRLAENGLWQITQDSRTDVGSTALRFYPVTEESTEWGTQSPIWRAMTSATSDSRFSTNQQSVVTSLSSQDTANPTVITKHVLDKGSIVGTLPETPGTAYYKTERTSGLTDITYWVKIYKVDATTNATLVSTSSSEHQHSSSDPALSAMQFIIPDGTELTSDDTLRFDFVGIKDGGGADPTLTVYFEDESGTAIDIGAPASSISHGVLRGRSVADQHPASAISYDNSTSGLAANNVQAGLDYLASCAVEGLGCWVQLDALSMVDLGPGTTVARMFGDVASPYTYEFDAAATGITGFGPLRVPTTATNLSVEIRWAIAPSATPDIDVQVQYNYANTNGTTGASIQGETLSGDTANRVYATHSESYSFTAGTVESLGFRVVRLGSTDASTNNAYNAWAQYKFD